MIQLHTDAVMAELCWMCGNRFTEGEQPPVCGLCAKHLTPHEVAVVKLMTKTFSGSDNG